MNTAARTVSFNNLINTTETTKMSHQKLTEIFQ